MAKRPQEAPTEPVRGGRGGWGRAGPPAAGEPPPRRSSASSGRPPGRGQADLEAATMAASSSSRGRPHLRRRPTWQRRSGSVTAGCSRACGAGSSSRLERSISSPAISLMRVSAGSITSSTKPRSAATYGLAKRSVYSSTSSLRRATGIGRRLQLAPVEDLDRALRAHHRQLGRRPGEGQVGADRLGVHDHVGAAVGLAGDDLDAGHGRLAVGVEQLGAVADDAAVLLVDAGQEARARRRT